MEPTYKIEMDDARGLLRVTVAGYWKPETSGAFFTDLAGVVGPLIQANQAFAVLADCRGFSIQSEEIGDRFAGYLSSSANTGKRAMVMGSVLGKMQAERFLTHPGVRVFLTIDEAEAWLANDVLRPSLASEKFDVRYDPALRRLCFTMQGLWTIEDFNAFAGALRATVAPMGEPPYAMDALSDARNFPPQRAEVADALSRLDEIARATRTGRTAIVVGSMINKLQAERNLDIPNIKVVLSMQEAHAWLDSNEAAAT